MEIVSSEVCKVSHNVIIWDHYVWGQVCGRSALKISAVAPWGSACLAHLYRALCRATRVNCKEIDGPLTLLLTWAWIRLPFPLANRWRNWDRDERAYRYHSLAHYKRVLDDLQEGQILGSCTKCTIFSYIFENPSSHKLHLLILQTTM
ncbi:hypothetical protein Ahy_A02g007585 [Arachis hypogaea]|uniref:Aminotransferase-like plant mobile domain-containing protein n=1 Tax=Arachis hypogaea TaxID=3818 RepID=A0A445ED46_ARAHY|nr:hypothetical protein Ahy_A02g007585 [Arachis hypogaea]